jgi:hypothetical protein
MRHHEPLTDMRTLHFDLPVPRASPTRYRRPMTFNSRHVFASTLNTAGRYFGHTISALIGDDDSAKLCRSWPDAAAKTPHAIPRPARHATSFEH